MKNKLLLAAAISVIIMGLLLSKIDWDQFSIIADRFDIKAILLAFGLMVMANVIRSIRFYKMDHMQNKLSHWWIMNQVYNLMTATLPGGAGEVATVYLLKKFSAFNVISSLRMLILTRLMDVTWLSALLFIAASQMIETTPYKEVATLVSAIMFLMSILFTYPKSERIIMKIVQKFTEKIKGMNKIYEKIKEMSEISENCFGKSLFGIATLLSALSIFCAALSVHLVMTSFGTEFVLIQSLYCFGVYAVFQVVPIQGIAGIGTQAAWWAIALSAAGYKAHDAIAMGIVLHATFYIFIAAMGISALIFIPMGRKVD